MKLTKIARVMTLCCIAIPLAACGALSGSNNTDWPPDRITMYVPLEPGGGTDIVARSFATELSEAVEVDVVVENNPGGGTVVGLNSLHGGEQDGSELMVVGTTIVSVEPAGQADLSPDDFTVLGVINADPPAIAVRDDAPWQTIDEFLDAARSSPDSVRVATGNPKGVWDVVATALMDSSDLPWRPIPTEGGAAASVQALLANEVEAAVMSPAEMREQIRAGNLRVLAVGSEERLPFLDDVPTFEESDLMPDPPGTFRPVLAPPELDDEAQEALTSAITEVAASDSFVDWQTENWLGPLSLGPDEASEYLDDQSEIFADFLVGAE